jgi:hypothetical protein
MRTTTQNRATAATVQPAPADSGSQAKARVADRRPLAIASQLESASRLGHRFDAVGMQPVLTVSPTNDRYEREARQTADHALMRIADPVYAEGFQPPRLSPLAASGGVQRDHTGGNGDGQPTSASSRDTAAILDAKGSGQALPGALRASMETALGANFSQVRIHHNPRSHALSRSLHARAFTVGSDIFFRQGEFDPQGRQGHRLLAHELAHTLQQRNARVLVQRQDDDEPNDEELARQFEQNQVRVGGGEQRISLPKAMHQAVETTEKGTELPATALGLADVSWYSGGGGGGSGYMDYAAHDPYPTSLIGGAPSIASLAAVPQEAKEAWAALKDAKGSLTGPDRSRTRAARRLGTAADKGLSATNRLYGAASLTGNLAWHGAKLAGNADVVTGAGNFLTVAGQMAPAFGIATGSASLAKSSYAAHKARKRMARLQEMLDEKPHSQATSDLALERQFRDSAVGMDGKPSSPKATSDFEIESQFRDSAVDKDGKRSPVEATSDDEIEDQFQESATDLSRRQLLAYALRNQRKRANRAAVNITSSTLQTAGNIVSTAGAPAAAGVAIAAAGTGVKYGAMAARKIKQKARDVRERQGQNRSKLGQFIDKVFDPDVTRSTDKKKGERKQMTNLLISGGHHDILEQMGAKPEHIALLQKPGRTQAEEQTLRAEVKRLWKKRE